MCGHSSENKGRGPTMSDVYHAWSRLPQSSINKKSFNYAGRKRKKYVGNTSHLITLKLSSDPRGGTMGLSEKGFETPILSRLEASQGS